MQPLTDVTTLSYSIHACSSVSSNYLAEHILVDQPQDQSSRWSSDSNSPPQFLVLELPQPSIVSAITFGKFEKTHVCNLKRFKVWAGLDPERLIEVLDSGLKNDTSQETFRLRHVVHGQFFPSKFLKIVPLQSWGPSFNFSIWFVALSGNHQPEIVDPALAWHQEYQEREAIRLCMKHFREKNCLEIFETLQRSTGVRLEHPLLSEIHKCLVTEGNYAGTEAMLAKAVTDGLFDQWIDVQVPRPKWEPRILPDDLLKDDNTTLGLATTPVNTPGQESPENEQGGLIAPHPQHLLPLPQDALMQPPPVHALAPVSGEAESPLSDDPSSTPPSCRTSESIPRRPTCRGGHQMVIDVSTQVIYMFGGWNGNKDMSDFWSYQIPQNKWTLISENTTQEGGPDHRSCHKMVLDPVYKLLFLLGRYLDRGLRDITCNVKSDFYMYDINAARWTLITDDTAALGGPSLIFDHQMCFDQQKRTIYVFGGSIVQTTEEIPLAGDKRCSGLYEYHIPTNTWKKRREESQASNESRNHQLRSRSSHSMLFHEGLRKLFVFGGNRKRDEHLNDFFAYSVDTDVVETISTIGNLIGASFPAVGHTQRATIDCHRNEIHVMTGLNKDKDRLEKIIDSKVSNSFWVYSIVYNTWTCFYKNENTSSEYWSRMQQEEPRPRYAHQLVFDDVNKVHYMFGGNPGGKQGKEDKMRLGDFWRLALLRPSRQDVLRQCQLSIRQSQFGELTQSNKMAALEYLQVALSAVVDHSDPKEEDEFRLLASQLFKREPTSSQLSTSTTTNHRNHHIRVDLYEKLTKFFPREMTHPRTNLIDLIPYPMELD
eukprot:maker-scaffold446_size168061-snap-gene-0.25 protein:Tk08585 transcript:maker-scaffold446_size168061-snap-gene-0.25-mRNA-1 annotation:"muskelin isoform x1"